MPSNLSLLEHVNLTIPFSTLPSARVFFYKCLLLTEDPRVALRASVGGSCRLLWANAGPCQVHLPVAEDATACQRVDGWLTLAYPPGGTDAAAHRLRAEGFAVTEQLGGGLRVAWEGNVFELVDLPSGAQLLASRGQPGFREEDGERAPGSPLGLLAVSVRAPAAALPAIAAFWERILAARVLRFSSAAAGEGAEESSADAEEAGSREGGAALSLTRVRVLVDGEAAEERGAQYIDFIAVQPEDPEPLLPFDGWHVALYLREWAGAYARAAAPGGGLYPSTRYSDRCDTFEAAQACRQFRTLTMAPGFDLELEIRSREHPACPL